MPQSKEKIVLVGGGGHASVIVSMLKKLPDFEIAGLVDPDKNCFLTKAYPEIKYLGDETALEGILSKDTAQCASVAVGSTGRDKNLRVEIFERTRKLGFKFPAIVSKDAIIDPSAEISDGTVIMPGAIVNRGARIGKNCIINTGTIVEHDTVVCDHVHLASGVKTGGAARIGRNTHIGTGAVIIHKVKIGSNCILGAGAVAVKDISDNSIAVGVPAKEKEL